MQFTVKRGQHVFRPVMYGPIKRLKHFKGIIYTVFFDESIKYDLGDSDQLDWNKGGGISYKLWSNNVESSMWGWRWNLNKEKVELTAYSNSRQFKRGRMMGNTKLREQVMLELDVYEKGTIIMQPSSTHKNTMSFQFKNGLGKLKNTVMHPISPKAEWTRQFGPWFGGNEEAPKQ